MKLDLQEEYLKLSKEHSDLLHKYNKLQIYYKNACDLIEEYNVEKKCFSNKPFKVDEEFILQELILYKLSDEMKEQKKYIEEFINITNIKEHMKQKLELEV